MSIALSHMWSTYIIIIVIGLFILITFFLLIRWHKRDTHPHFKTILIMRTILVFLIALLFLSPVFSYFVEKTRKKTIAVLLDTSESMFVGSPKTRYDLGFDFVGKLNSNEDLDRFNLHLYRFDEKLQRVKSIDELPLFSEKEIIQKSNLITSLGDIFSLAGEDLAGVLVISDGLDTSDGGSFSLSDVGVNIFAYIPDVMPDVDMSVKALNLDKPLVSGVATSAQVELSAIGLQSRKCEISLFQDDLLIVSKTFTPDSDTWNGDVVLRFTPRVGLSLFRVEVLADGDKIEENDSFIEVSNVREEGLKTLLISSSPSPEYSTYKNIFLQDNLLSLSTVCYTPSGALVGEETTALIPETLSVLDRYDFIVLLNPIDDILSEVFLSNLLEYLRRGGGLCVVVTSETDVPDGLSGILPVIIGGEVEDGFSIHPVGFIPSSLQEDLLSLDEGRGLLYGPSDVSVKLWGNILSSDDSGRARIVEGTSGAGRVVVIAFGGLHRLRSAGRGEGYYTLITNIGRFLGLSHSSGIFRVIFDMEKFDEEIKVDMKIVPRFEMSQPPLVKIFREEDGGELILSQGVVNEEGGEYHYQFTTDLWGVYMVDIETSYGVQREYLYIEDENEEMRNLIPDYSLLNYISRGNIISEDDIDEIVEKLGDYTSITKRERITLSIVRNPIIYLLIILVLSMEWYLRRIWGLQ